MQIAAARHAGLSILMVSLLTALTGALLIAVPAHAAPTVSTLSVGDRPAGVSISPDRRSAYVAENGADSVRVIDLATKTTVGSLAVSKPFMTALSPSGGRLYVSSQSGGAVKVFDTDTDTDAQVASIAVGRTPQGLAVLPSGDKLYVANFSSASVSVIDTATNQVTETIAVGDTPMFLAATPSGDRVVVTSGHRSVSVIDTTTDTVTATVTEGVATGIYQVATSDTHAFVTHSLNGTVSVIDLATHAVTSTISLGGTVAGAVMSPSGLQLYVTDYHAAQLHMIDVESGALTSTMAVTAGAFAIAAQGPQLVLSNYHVDAVTFISVPFVSPARQTRVTTVGTPIAATAALGAEGIAGTPTFSVSPALPAGMQLNPSTGVISGTPTIARRMTTYRVTATDGVDSATAAVPLTVEAIVAPAIQSVRATVGVAVQPTLPLTTAGLSGTATYAVSPALPTGLTLDPSTGVITGTPSEAQIATSYKITGTDGVVSASSTLTIEVVAVVDVPPVPLITPSKSSITGAKAEGRTLTAHPSAAGTGAYQWFADGVTIKGATRSTYTLRKREAGRRITVAVTTNGQTVVSARTKIVSSRKPRLVLSSRVVHGRNKFRVTATGLRRGQDVRVWLGGLAMYVGTADSRGVVDRSVRFSAKTEPGTRRVRVSGYTAADHRAYTIFTTLRLTATSHR